VDDAPDGVEFGVANPDLDLRMRLDVAHPIGALALGNKVEAPAVLGEPDLDFSRLPGDATSGGQIEVHGIGRPSYHDALARMTFGEEPLSRASDIVLRIRADNSPQGIGLVRLGAKRPLFGFADLWSRWRGVRRPKSAPVEGEHELSGFLTTEANAIVAPIHLKAMPVILKLRSSASGWRAKRSRR
jgi:hypothetical protein